IHTQVRSYSGTIDGTPQEGCRMELGRSTEGGVGHDETKDEHRTGPTTTSAKEFTLITDASGTGLGAVLCQPDENGKLAPIAFISRKLKGSEQNYPVREQEGLAVYWAIENLRPLLQSRKFTVKTDHKSLLALPRSRGTSSRLDKWFSKLEADYVFTL